MQQVSSFEKAQVFGRPIIFVCSETMALRRRIRIASIATSKSPLKLAAFDDVELLNHCLERIAKSQGRHVSIDLVLDATSDFSIVRRVWKRFENDADQSITLRVSLSNPRDEAPFAVNQLILDLDDHHPVLLQNKFEAVTKQSSPVASVTMTRRAPLFWPCRVAQIFLTTNPQEVLFDALSELTINRDTRIIFLRGALPNLHKRVARDFWKQVFANEIPEVLSCDDVLQCVPLRLFETAQPTTLFVFPERMLPLQRAYYLRAFDMLLGLNYAGEATAALVLGPNNADLARIQRALEIVSPRVFADPLKRGGYPLHHYAARRAEIFMRRLIDVHTAPPLRFIERCYTFATKHHTNLLSKAQEQLPGLRSVVFTGAWFTPSVRPVKARNPLLKCYCDTHDVFFVLDSDSNQNERRFFYSPEQQKRRELEYLNGIDGVIAISEADQESIKAAGCKSQVIVENGSFSHAARRVQVQHGPIGLVFGFIGSNNKNNEKCLHIVRTSWWPAIKSLNPDAQLLIAGGVCKLQEAALLESEFPEAVRRLGFVPILSKFYGSVQAMLSPITVQGGLNFKSVEALVAGRPLLTNQLGSRCIGTALEGVCVIGANAEGIDEVITRLLQNKSLQKWREAIHREAMLRFSDDVAYRRLITILKSVT